MGGLIWIIVIVVVISEIKKFQRKNGQRVKPNVPDAAPAAGHAPESDTLAAECAPEPDGRTAECAPEPDAGTADAECRRGCHGRLPQTAA